MPRSPSWGLFTFDPQGMEDAELNRLKGMLLDAATRNGLPLGAPTVLQNVHIHSPEEIINVFHNVEKRANLELLFIGMPSRHDHDQSNAFYKKVKVCEGMHPRIKTQCFKTSKARKNPPGKPNFTI